MAALNQDTRLVMTILFVGALSGTNVWAYAAFGMNFPYGPLAHSVLFGLGTILDRKIAAYWERKARDEQQKIKMRESAKQFTNSPFAYTQPVEAEENTLGTEFLATLQ